MHHMHIIYDHESPMMIIQTSTWSHNGLTCTMSHTNGSHSMYVRIHGYINMDGGINYCIAYVYF